MFQILLHPEQSHGIQLSDILLFLSSHRTRTSVPIWTRASRSTLQHRWCSQFICLTLLSICCNSKKCKGIHGKVVDYLNVGKVVALNPCCLEWAKQRFKLTSHLSKLMNETTPLLSKPSHFCRGIKYFQDSTNFSNFFSLLLLQHSWLFFL